MEEVVREVNVKHYLQSHLLGVCHSRSAVQLTAEDAVESAEVDWLGGEHSLQLLVEHLPLSDLS